MEADLCSIQEIVKTIMSGLILIVLVWGGI